MRSAGRAATRQSAAGSTRPRAGFNSSSPARMVHAISDAIGTLLVYAYPDRIARRRPNERERYQLATGRLALLPPADPLAASEYLVVPQLDAGRTEGRIFLAESLGLSELKQHHGDLLTETQTGLLG